MEKLVAKARGGDVAAFEQLVKDNMQGMYKVAFACVRNDEDAADAIQETILTCWEKLEQLKEPSAFRAWMTRILVNNCNALLRGRSKQAPVDSVPELVDEKAQAPQVEFREALGLLREEYRVPIVLYYAYGFKTREIAQILELPESTVTTRLSRARKELEQYYRPVECEGAQA